MALLDLKEDKLPLLFVLLLGFITWGLEHIVSESLNIPLVTYSISKSKISDSTTRLTYNFINLSREKKFCNIDLLYIFPKNCINFGGNYVPDKSAIADKEIPFEINELHKAGMFHISEQQPLSSFQIIIMIDKDKIPQLRYHSPETLLLKPNSFKIFLIKYEFEIILFLISGSIVSLFIYAIKYKSDETV